MEYYSSPSEVVKSLEFGVGQEFEEVLKTGTGIRAQTISYYGGLNIWNRVSGRFGDGELHGKLLPPD